MKKVIKQSKQGASTYHYEYKNVTVMEREITLIQELREQIAEKTKKVTLSDRAVLLYALQNTIDKK